MKGRKFFQLHQKWCLFLSCQLRIIDTIFGAARKIFMARTGNSTTCFLIFFFVILHSASLKMDKKTMQTLLDYPLLFYCSITIIFQLLFWLQKRNKNVAQCWCPVQWKCTLHPSRTKAWESNLAVHSQCLYMIIWNKGRY